MAESSRNRRLLGRGSPGIGVQEEISLEGGVLEE
jgi:hypothetical protein